LKGVSLALTSKTRTAKAVGIKMASPMMPATKCSLEPKSALTVTEYEFTDSVIEFLGVVLVPVGNFDDDVGGAVGDGLAAEA
jgi:hypothetical protein